MPNVYTEKDFQVTCNCLTLKSFAMMLSILQDLVCIQMKNTVPDGAWCSHYSYQHNHNIIKIVLVAMIIAMYSKTSSLTVSLVLQLKSDIDLLRITNCS